ncbi:MAG: hypothetical protein EPN64_11035 [Burkholderiaceae bacterium]|nr:MAG: hypothetical protein EPN64_11035 [Burkholderiaceae bacterium]
MFDGLPERSPVRWLRAPHLHARNGTAHVHAKEKALSARNEIAQGIDPIVQRKAAISSLRAQQATEKTFEQAAQGYLAAHGDTWRNPKHRAQWKNTLETYAYPHMGKLLVRDVAQEHVMAALTPIWKTKTETATRLRG